MFGQKQDIDTLRELLLELGDRLGAVTLKPFEVPNIGPYISDWIEINYHFASGVLEKYLFSDSGKEHSLGAMYNLLKEKYGLEYHKEFSGYYKQVQLFRSPFLPFDLVKNGIDGKLECGFWDSRIYPVFEKNGVPVSDLTHIPELRGFSGVKIGPQGVNLDFYFKSEDDRHLIFHKKLGSDKKDPKEEFLIRFPWLVENKGGRTTLADFFRAVYWNFNREGYCEGMREVLTFPTEIQEFMTKSNIKYQFRPNDRDEENHCVSEELPDEFPVCNPNVSKKDTYGDWKSRTGARLGKLDGGEGGAHVFYNEFGEIHVSYLPVGPRFAWAYL